MHSHLADALRLQYAPLAITWSDTKPANAIQFAKGKWGCVMAAFATVAQTGRPAAFDKDTYGCWGGGVGLGFGNAYQTFPGGEECFCRFLSTGNASDSQGQAVANACASWMKGHFLDDFLHGERYRKSPALVERFLRHLPMRQIPTQYAVIQRLADVPDDAQPASVVFLANPDQLSALVVLSTYDRPDLEGAKIPFVAGCQSIGIMTYDQAAAEHPHAIVGLNDLSARAYTRKLGPSLVTVSVPYNLFQQMESNVPNSFLQQSPWTDLAPATTV